MYETLHSPKYLITTLKHNLLFLYKIKLKFKKIYCKIKIFYNAEFLENYDKYFQDIFYDIEYEIITKKQILSYLKNTKKGLVQSKYEIILNLSTDFKIYEEMFIKKITYLTNVINAYNGNYTFSFNNNIDEQLILIKRNIEDKIENLRF